MKITNNYLLLPSDTLSVEDILIQSGRTKEEADKTIAMTGIHSIHRTKNKSLSRFVLDGLSLIANKSSCLLKNVDAIIVVSQTYDNRIPSLSTRIQRKLDLPHDTYCIDVIDGCSGFIKAISIAEMLEAKGLKRVLIIAGDLNSLITEKADVGTKILFGDGVAVSILSSDANQADTFIQNNGDESGVISCLTEDNLMHMNGFEVFRFTRNVVPPLINQYLDQKNVDIDTFDLVALHQASKLVVSTICSTLKIKNKLADNFNCGDIGNLGAGSIGAWLAKTENLVGKGKLSMLAVGYGAGLSWGLASLYVELETNEVICADC